MEFDKLLRPLKNMKFSKACNKLTVLEQLYQSMSSERDKKIKIKQIENNKEVNKSFIGQFETQEEIGRKIVSGNKTCHF